MWTAPAVSCLESTADVSTCTDIGQELYTRTRAASGGGTPCTGSSTLCVAGDGSIPADCEAEFRNGDFEAGTSEDCAGWQALADAAAFVGPPCAAGDACSPLQPAGPDGIALVAPSLEAAITLNADISSIGTVGDATYDTFVATFEADMATVLSISQEQVEVTSVAAGSISCSFTVMPSGTGVPVPPSALASSFAEPGISVGGIETTAALALEDIAETAAACNSPDVLETVINCTTFYVNNAERIVNFTIQLTDAVSNAEDPEDVAAIAEGLGETYFEMRSLYCNSSCAVPLQPRWQMCNKGLYVAESLPHFIPFTRVALIFC